MSKRRIFISFDYDDTEKANGFLGLRSILDNSEFYNHKLGHRINSRDEKYVKRAIREEYIRLASVTVVLIGNRTAYSTWVKWEIAESIRQGKGLLGIHLKGIDGPVPEGLPQNHVGNWQADRFAEWIERAYQNR